ncbi:MAG: peptide/nickel transport system ATP-binding protein [Thermosipho sp. (in: thermotogales)]|nr:peptide/nickel transport system ATP-binding protein [Thermosipho sp. (in: thermotogales)]
MIEVTNLTKAYSIGSFGKEKFYAVDNVSFKIDDNQIVSLIGESGSGKTTIGKLILKLIKPTSGEILFQGKNIKNLKNKEYYRYVQGVFQDPFSSYNPIFKINRVFDMVREEFYPKTDKDKWNEKVEKVISEVGLNPKEILGKFPHQLSGGQLQRLLIARTLLMETKFLVAMEYGDTEKVFNNPLHPYTIMLMNSVPTMNKKWTKEELIAESRRTPPGYCKFYDRCPLADKECKNVQLKKVEEEHYVACVKK